MPEQTIAAGVVRALAELAISKGADVSVLYKVADLTPNDLVQVDARIPLARYEALMHAGQRLCHDPALALHFGEAFDLAEISIAGAIDPPTQFLADNLALLNRYAPLAVDVGGPSERFVLSRRRGHVFIIDQRPNPNAFPELTESTFARMVCMARRHQPGLRFLREVHVTHRAPPYRAEYDRVFQTPIVFESDCNALLTDSEWLTRKVTPAARYVADVLNAHADSLLEELGRSKTMRGRVEAALLPLLSQGDARIDVVARAMGLSRQTLFRRLRAEGVTFEQVLDELRCSLAITYVADEKTPVSEIARRLGFADATALSRAFKRWTGASPRARRRSADR
jgi:AraC-like DNA-binding protein